MREHGAKSSLQQHSSSSSSSAAAVVKNSSSSSMADSIGLEAAVSGTWMMMFIYIYIFMEGWNECIDELINEINVWMD